ncbi:hypothetical protein [Nannocystis bainbridge]|uniref:Uncharacterized protein n=1 Tax=Nannocystis bainbridge TaxID=2995303 RepID=A0ABT5DWI9_9BACT|nr:hypothetical protein [Nannocystis bainbridge]MDC0718004.1 hypothetical protein [Nannocystis bainbridge]
MSEPAIRFVLYSEDRAGDALQTLEHLLRGMLKHMEPALKSNHVLVEPVLPAQERVSGSYWKSYDAQRLRRLLVGAVARALALGKIVFFHVDADAVWSGGWRGCEHLSEHWPRFCADVLRLLQASKSATGPGDLTELERVLILAMPFYELESWAFTNFGHLGKIVTELTDNVTLVRWQTTAGCLDEIADIKDELKIGGTRNLELVQLKNGFPVAALVQARKSYFATMARLRSSEVVRRGLADAASRPY